MVACNAKLAEGQGSKMKILKWLKKEKINPIHIQPGDTFSVSYTDQKGQSNPVIFAEIKEKMTVDEVRIGMTSVMRF